MLLQLNKWGQTHWILSYKHVLLLHKLTSHVMKKIIDIVLRVLLSLILIMPILGILGVFPEPTADLYNTPEAFEFIQVLMASKYIMVLEGVVFAAALICLWTKRVALAALLLLPITVNIIGFHLMLDGGLHKPGAIMADVLLLLNLYFLWQQRAKYKVLLKKS